MLPAFCAALWLLDEYWKYTLMTLGMILIFEATTAFSRQRNMQTLRGGDTRHSAQGVPVGRVATVPSTSLLPGDIVSLRREAGADAPVVPADCLLLRGRAVVNESTLTGESVPQMKDALTVEAKTADTALDMRGAHRVHVLFSGTSLVQHGGAAEVDAPTLRPAVAARRGGGANASEVPDPPDGGCVCYVLATAFSSSQGELMWMIEFSTAQVSSDKKETLLLLILLLFFALLSAGYVMKRGLEEGKKSQYELALRCVQIITSVVPPELPMQTALAVNTALMALVKAQIFCTEPYRVPLAGKLTHTFFDKTGTLTTDELIAKGVVNAASAGNGGGAVALGALGSASQELSCVVGGCHALLQVQARSATQSSWLLSKGSMDLRPNGGDRRSTTGRRRRRRRRKRRRRRRWRRSGAAHPPPSWRPARQGDGGAQVARWRGGAAEGGGRPPFLAVRPIQRHHFASALQRMSTVAHVKGCAVPTAVPRREACLVKDRPRWWGPCSAPPPMAAPASQRGTTRPTPRSPSRASACWRWRTSGARGRRCRTRARWRRALASGSSRTSRLRASSRLGARCARTHVT